MYFFLINVLLLVPPVVEGAAFYPLHSSSGLRQNFTFSLPGRMFAPGYHENINDTAMPDDDSPQIKPRLTSKRLEWFASTFRSRNLRFPPQKPPMPQSLKRSPSPVENLDTRPTPEPTGAASSETTVHISDEGDFSLIMPVNDHELIAEAERHGVSYCTPNYKSSCSSSSHLPDGFITGAMVSRSSDDSYIQVTGCFNSQKFSKLDPTDEGGQFDVRFPDGAQCAFGGYGASFIEQIEPAAGRFCLRCCASPNDQVNCNSHQDRQGCLLAIPGVYDFPDLGISCS